MKRFSTVALAILLLFSCFSSSAAFSGNVETAVSHESEITPTYSLTQTEFTTPPAANPKERVTGMITGLRFLPDEEFRNVVYAAPNGTAQGEGTKAEPLSITAALSRATDTPGITILLLDGTYVIANANPGLRITTSGTENRYKTLKAAHGANVKLDFSALSNGNRGLQLNGSYWYIAGIEFYNAGNNGLRIEGHYNVVEHCVFNANRNTGLHIGGGAETVPASWPRHNYIINCTSFDSIDPRLEDADGFAAKLQAGDGNVFDGCIAYNNIDDGWDFYARATNGPIGIQTIQNSICAWSGDTTDKQVEKSGGTTEGGGFKLGGEAQPTPHKVYNTLSFENGQHNYTDNNNPGELTVKYATSIDGGQSTSRSQGRPFSIYRTSTSSVYDGLLTVQGGKSKFDGVNTGYMDALVGRISNSVYYRGEFRKVEPNANTPINQGSIIPGEVITGPTADDFVEFEPPEYGANLHSLWRNENGTINTHGYMEVKETSPFYGMGAVFNGNYTEHKIGVRLISEPEPGDDPDVPIMTEENVARSRERTATVEVTTTRNGTIYYKVTERGEPLPSANEIRNNGNGRLIVVGITTPDKRTLNVSGMSGFSAKTLHIIQDNNGKVSEPIAVNLPPFIPGGGTQTLVDVWDLGCKQQDYGNDPNIVITNHIPYDFWFSVTDGDLPAGTTTWGDLKLNHAQQDRIRYYVQENVLSERSRDWQDPTRTVEYADDNYVTDGYYYTYLDPTKTTGSVEFNAKQGDVIAAYLSNNRVDNNSRDYRAVIERADSQNEEVLLDEVITARRPGPGHVHPDKPTLEKITFIAPSDGAYLLNFQRIGSDQPPRSIIARITRTRVVKNPTSVKFDTAANGSFSVSVGDTPIQSNTEIEEGTTVTLNATPNDGYLFKGWLICGLGVDFNSSTTFVMPSYNVIIEPIFGEPSIGDCNNDGRINIADLTYLKYSIVGLLPPNEQCFITAPKSETKPLPDASDITKLKRFLTGIDGQLTMYN
ncbi:MAG: right-handed parallel beta-helix repeat-containing protein [Oscillospiraceae bacterium]|nr:right-handed parallel beta-helix repeat-containing protein [Oscillospiraceae bacterium]